MLDNWKNCAPSARKEAVFSEGSTEIHSSIVQLAARTGIIYSFTILVEYEPNLSDSFGIFH